MKLNFLAVIVSLASILISANTNAKLISFDSFDNGWYTDDGGHTPSNTNTLVGTCCGTGNHNAFFNFNLGNQLQDAVINSASITFLQNGNYSSSDPFEILQLFDVTTTPDITNSVDIYNDLMTGTLYGEARVSSNSEFTVVLNNLSFADILADSFFSIGAYLSTATGLNQSIFSDSRGVGVARLNINYAPKDSVSVSEPSTLAIVALSIFGLLIRRFSATS